jgi:co-chaperonin GroES (HSP10)
MKALNNRIFLKKDEDSGKIGEFFVPKKEGMYAPPYTGTIISVGSNVTDLDFKEGIKVAFHDLAGVELNIEGEKIFSIRDIDVAAILF